MKLTVEFDWEGWRLRRWRADLACRLFGHPGWKPPEFKRDWLLASLLDRNDQRLRCVRCRVPHPDEPKLEPFTHTFEWSDKAFS